MEYRDSNFSPLESDMLKDSDAPSNPTGRKQQQQQKQDNDNRNTIIEGNPPTTTMITGSVRDPADGRYLDAINNPASSSDALAVTISETLSNSNDINATSATIDVKETIDGDTEQNQQSMESYLLNQLNNGDQNNNNKSVLSTDNSVKQNIETDKNHLSKISDPSNPDSSTNMGSLNFPNDTTNKTSQSTTVTTTNTDNNMDTNPDDNNNSSSEEDGIHRPHTRSYVAKQHQLVKQQRKQQNNDPNTDAIVDELKFMSGANTTPDNQIPQSSLYDSSYNAANVIGNNPTNPDTELTTTTFDNADGRDTDNSNIASTTNNNPNNSEQPFYVNAKQYYRILKRRYARAKLEEKLRISRERKPYLHESRHKHAMRRPRGQGGRFLTAAEIKALKEKEATEKEPNEDDKENNNNDKDNIRNNCNTNKNTSGDPHDTKITKNKSSNKKIKSTRNSPVNN